jgi:hypothetical protein
MDSRTTSSEIEYKKRFCFVSRDTAKNTSRMYHLSSFNAVAICFVFLLSFFRVAWDSFRVLGVLKMAMSKNSVERWGNLGRCRFQIWTEKDFGPNRELANSGMGHAERARALGEWFGEFSKSGMPTRPDGPARRWDFARPKFSHLNSIILLQ